MNRLPAIHCAAVVAFAATAVAGLLFLALGPVALIRTFGLVALLAGVGGCAIHAVLARAEAPGCWEDLVARLGWQGKRSTPNTLPGALAPAAS